MFCPYLFGVVDTIGFYNTQNDSGELEVNTFSRPI
jgi:hypothetical protein